MRLPLLLFSLGLVSTAYPQEWGELAIIAPDLGVHAGRLCQGNETEDGIGCPTHAPSLAPSGNLTVNGTVNATAFSGDGSALTNLPAPTSDGLPSGAILAFALTSCPTGWSEYTPARGRFLRGRDSAGTTDPDGVRAIGNVQADTLASHLHSINPPPTDSTSAGAHTHTGTAASAGAHTHDVPSRQRHLYPVTGANPASVNNNNYNDSEANPMTTTSAGAHTHTLSITSAGAHVHEVDIPAFNSANTGGSETRPKNVAVLYCVKS